MDIPPFLSVEPLQGDPACGWADFLSPKLRRFPRHSQPIHWKKHLGHGGEGIAEAVTFGDSGDSFVLKMFFQTKPSLSDYGYEYGPWALEGEALTVASLEQVCAGLRQASPSPVYVPAQRASRVDALSSLFACSLEGQQKGVYSDRPENRRVTLSALFAATRVRRCHGWVRLKGETIRHLNDYITIDERGARKGDLMPTCFEPEQHYFGLVYEYLPPATLEVDAVQRQIDFFHYAGFVTCQPANRANWQGPGIKLDFGDHQTPIDPEFEALTYYMTPTKAWYVLDLPDPCPGAPAEAGETKEETDRRLDRWYALARSAEREYCVEYFATGKGSRPPASVGEGKLLPPHLQHDTRVPEIEPHVVWVAWEQYRQKKRKYLNFLDELEAAGAEVTKG